MAKNELKREVGVTCKNLLGHIENLGLFPADLRRANKGL